MPELLDFRALPLRALICTRQALSQTCSAGAAGL